MKSFLLFILLSLVNALPSFAENCKVSGISDSPQNVTCHYRDGWNHAMELQIRCQDGKYVFHELANGSPISDGDVTVAYHEEVSSGASPLVFKMPEHTLRITRGLLFFHGEFVSENHHQSPRFRCGVK